MGKTQTRVWKLSLVLLVLGTMTSAGRAISPDWYEDSFIHTHISLNLPVEHLDFIKKQIEEVKPDAIQFHTHDLRLIKAVKDQGIDEEFGFKVVATINHAGVWYPHYEQDERYVLRINADGTFAGRWSRKHLCFTAPAVEEVIIPEKYIGIPELIRPDQVWIDESVITVNVCYCHNCIANYKKLYGKEPPRELTADNFPEWEQWVKLHRDTFVHWMKAIVDAVHSVDPDILVTVNHAYFVEQPEPLPDWHKNLSGDIHKDPLELGFYAKYAASIEAPFDLMPGLGDDIWAGNRPKKIEQICNEISIIVAYGGRWNIGEFPTDFLSLRTEEKYRKAGYRRADLYLDLAKKGADFARERQSFCMGKRQVPCAAILHSARTHYSHVIFNTNNVKAGEDFGMTSDGHLSRNESGKINSRIYWPDNKWIVDDMVGAYEALVENHVQFDIVYSEYFRDNMDKYKLLVLAEQTYLEDETVRAIKAFVRQGGTVIASGSTIKAGLDDVFGVHGVSTSEPVKPTYTLGDEEVIFGNFAVVRPGGAQVVKCTIKPVHPMVTVNDYGKGKAVYIAGDIFKEYFRRSGYAHTPKGDDANIRRFMNDVLTMVLPQGGQAIEIAAQPWQEVNLMQDDSSVYAHVINRRMNWKQPASEAEAVGISLPMARKPAWVKLQPGGAAHEFDYDNGRLTVEVTPEQIGFHRAIEIKR